LSRVIWGSRASLAVSAGAVIIGVSVGIPIRLVAGFYRGGWAFLPNGLDSRASNDPGSFLCGAMQHV